MLEDQLIKPWFDDVAEQLGGSVDVLDAHAHVGSRDPDGFRLSPEELLTRLDLIGSRAIVMPMHEPDGYPEANDVVIETSAASAGRLIPFCRVDPNRDPVTEVLRCLDAGARGIKLHPRSEGFGLSDPGVADVVAVANQHRLPVLIHAGRGIPTLGTDALVLAERYPDARLILAHAAICDLSWIWREAPAHPNLFFDTSWWHPADLAALISLIPPGQLVYGSDPPYFSPVMIATSVARLCLQAGLDRAQVLEILGGRMQKILDGDELPDLGPPPGEEWFGSHILLERIASLLVLAVGRMILGDSGYEPLALARLGCDLGDVQARDADVCRNILTLLDRHEHHVLTTLDQPSPMFPGTPIVMLAAMVARTPDVSLPDVPELATGEEIRRASWAGHRAIDPRMLAAEQHAAGARDLRRSSAADHLIIDPATMSRPPREDR